MPKWKSRMYKVPKKDFADAEDAWNDLKPKIKVDLRGLKFGPHTSRSWVFIVT